MADLASGSRVRALDFPPAVEAYDNTQILNVSTSGSWTAGSPVVEATFVAPTTGRVWIATSASMRDDTGGERIRCAPHIESVTTGLVLVIPDAGAYGVINAGGSTLYETRSRDVLIEGLVPGDVYLARHMHRVSAGSTADIRGRGVTVTPAR